jgi:ATP-dependent RNA helicase DDX60
MVKHQTEQYPVNESLDPEVALPKLVKKSDVVKWEIDLKHQLAEWMVDHKSPFESVRADLRGDRYLKLVANHDDESDHQNQANSGPVVSSRSAFSLVVDLRANGALPAIFFNYDRSGCEVTMRHILDTLVAAEVKYKQTNPAWLAKVAEFEKWKKAREISKAKDSKKATAKPSKDQDGLSKADQSRDEANRETSSWESFNPDAPLSQFCFADTMKMTNEEVEVKIRELEWHNIAPPFIDGLRRGLGVHHSGMNRQYRQV